MLVSLTAHASSLRLGPTEPCLWSPFVPTVSGLLHPSHPSKLQPHLRFAYHILEFLPSEPDLIWIITLDSLLWYIAALKSLHFALPPVQGHALVGRSNSSVCPLSLP